MIRPGPCQRPRVRVTLGQDADGRVRFEFREPENPAGARRR
jgi:hypothetical protein